MLRCRIQQMSTRRNKRVSSHALSPCLVNNVNDCSFYMSSNCDYKVKLVNHYGSSARKDHGPKMRENTLFSLVIMKQITVKNMYKTLTCVRNFTERKDWGCFTTRQSVGVP